MAGLDGLSRPPRDTRKEDPRDVEEFNESLAINAIPPGFGPVPFAGSTAPAGWLFCYGQAVSRTTYRRLFQTIGTTYGSGDESTTFNLPDMRGRTWVGLDNMGGSSANVITLTEADNLGGTFGDEDGAASAITVDDHAGIGNHTHPNVGFGAGSTGAGGSHTPDSHVVNNGTGLADTTVQPSIAGNWIIKF